MEGKSNDKELTHGLHAISVTTLRNVSYIPIQVGNREM